jgi:hypothetical protein
MMMPPVEPNASLQKLLREYHDIGEMILDIAPTMKTRPEGGSGRVGTGRRCDSGGRRFGI